MRYLDGALIRLNLLLLMAVAFLPFPTSLVGETIAETKAERAAVLFYGAALLAISLILTAMLRYAARRVELLHEETDAEDVYALASRTTPSLVFYGLVLMFAIIKPAVAALGFLVIAVSNVLRRPTAAPSGRHG